MVSENAPRFEQLYARIASLPEGLTGEILEPGVLRTMGRPGRRHRRAAKACLRALGAFDEDAGGSGWWIEQEAEIQLPGPRLVVPDLAGWRTERVPRLPEENPLSIIPDWCCEVLSPAGARDDRLVKLPLLARSGVAWIWLVDPERSSVEVFETRGGVPALVATGKDDDRLVLPPFNLEIALESWWILSEP